VVNKAALGRATIVERLLQGIEHEAGMRRARDAPADDAPCIGIDDAYSDAKRPLIPTQGGQ
jgi:hypothetical protein